MTPTVNGTDTDYEERRLKTRQASNVFSLDNVHDIGAIGQCMMPQQLWQINATGDGNDEKSVTTSRSAGSRHAENARAEREAGDQTKPGRRPTISQTYGS